MFQSQRGTGLLSRPGERQGNDGGVGKPSSASTPDLPAAALSLPLLQTASAEQNSSVTESWHGLHLPGGCLAQPYRTSLLWYNTGNWGTRLPHLNTNQIILCNGCSVFYMGIMAHSLCTAQSGELQPLFSPHKTPQGRTHLWGSRNRQSTIWGENGYI